MSYGPSSGNNPQQPTPEKKVNQFGKPLVTAELVTVTVWRCSKCKKIMPLVDINEPPVRCSRKKCRRMFHNQFPASVTPDESIIDKEKPMVTVNLNTPITLCLNLGKNPIAVTTRTFRGDSLIPELRDDCALHYRVHQIIRDSSTNETWYELPEPLTIRISISNFFSWQLDKDTNEYR